MRGLQWVTAGAFIESLYKTAVDELFMLYDELDDDLSISGFTGFYTTRRDLGFCPGAVVDLYMFNQQTDISDTFLGHFVFNTISITATGGFYSSQPLIVDPNIHYDPGYCDYYHPGRSSDIISATNLLHWLSTGKRSTPDMFLAGSSMERWLAISTTEKRTRTSHTGKPVVTMIAVSDDQPPAYAEDQANLTTVDPQYASHKGAFWRRKRLDCLKKHSRCLQADFLTRDHTINEIMDDGCVLTRPSNDTLWTIERELNDLVCPLLFNSSDPDSLASRQHRILRELGTEEQSLEQEPQQPRFSLYGLNLSEHSIRSVQQLLATKNYTLDPILTATDESLCPYPDLTTRETIRQVGQKIQADYLLYTTNLTPMPEDLIREFAALLGLPEEKVLVSTSTDWSTMADLLPVTSCSDSGYYPTVAPDDPDDKCKDCERHYSITMGYLVVIGSGAGAFIGYVALKMLTDGSILDPQVELDDQLDTEPIVDPNELQHVLFAN